METEVSPMESLLTNLGLVVTEMFSLVGDVATTIINSPLLLITSGILLAGAAVGIFGRFLSRS